MSLFGAKPAGQTVGSSMFGGNAAANAAPSQPTQSTMSPFGRPQIGGGSLFANSTNTTQPSQPSQSSPFPSLSGAASTTQQTQGSNPNPFAGLPGANTQQQQPNPFGGLPGATTANTQQQQQQQQQPQTQGMFGAINNNQQTQPGGMFSTTTQAQPAPGGLGLGLSTNNQPLGASILGGGQANNNNNNNNTSSLPQGNTTGYFDTLLSKSKKQASEQSPLEDLPSLHLGLGDLRQRLRKLGPQTGPVQQDKARYILAASGVEPAAAVRDLNEFDVRIGSRIERPTSAHTTAEIDVDAYLANLQTKTTLSMIADGLERSARDFDNFLEDNITMEWEAQRKRIYEHFGIKTDDGSAEGASGAPSRESQAGFGRSRRTAKASRSTAPGIKASTFGRSNLQKSVIGTPSKIGAHEPEFTDVQDTTRSTTTLNGVASMDDRYLRDKQAMLAAEIRDLNLARIAGEPHPILHRLGKMALDNSTDRHAHSLYDAYLAAIAIVGEKEDAETWSTDAGTTKQRQFRDQYLDTNEKSAASLEMRKRILNGANAFLEGKFFKEVESIITKFPREANLGGRPDTINKIKAYVRLRHARKDLVPDNTELQQVEGEFVWAIVFYLLRSGKINEAADYVKAQSTTFRSIDRTFASYLLEYVSSPDRRLRRQLQERCNNEFNQRFRNAPENSIDPYRMACYKIVGRCAVSNRNLDNLNTEIDDWIWLQFNLARENDKATEVAAESYGLQDLRTSIREIGLKHFPKSPSEDDNGSFGMYFFLQILSGMFEQAIAYLYAFSYVDAIHFAIALEYYGLLRPSDPWTTTDSLLSHDTRSRPQLSFGRMLGYYTRDFRAADVDAAVDYLTLICLNADLEGEAGRQQAELCHVALRELILESREFSKLIGDIRPDGHRILGLVEQRASLIGLREEDDFVKTVTLQAARFADDNGRTTDAVLLYHLASDYDSVISIVSRALSEAISLEIGEDPMRLMPVKPRSNGKDPEAQPGSSLSLASIDDPIQLAVTMMTMYEKDAMFYTKIEEQNRVACSILLQLSEIKTLVAGKMWPEALDVSFYSP